MLKFIQTSIANFVSDKEREGLKRVIAPSFVIHFFAAILTLALMFLMTRTLGATQYGIYTYSFSIAFVIINLCGSGINILSTREISSFLSKRNIGQWKGFYKWSLKWILRTSIIATLISIILLSVFAHFSHSVKVTSYMVPLILALLIVPFYCLLNYFSANLMGQHKTVLALLTDNIIKPSIFLVFVLFILFYSGSLTLQNAIILNIFSCVAGFVFVFFLFRKTIRFQGIAPEYDTVKWKKSWRSLFFFTVVVAITSKIDILMLGMMKRSAEVGIYNIADRVAASFLVFLMVTNRITAASISRLNALNEKQKLQAFIRKISRWVMVFSLPAFAFIIIFSKRILSYFGPEFTYGQEALIIICIGQLFSIVFGPVGNLSLMTGNEKYNIRFSIIKILINILVNIILTPTMGLNGTAIATAAGVIFWNVGMFIAIRKETGLKTWIFG